MSETPQVLLTHYLKTLRFSTFLREYDKLARQCAGEIGRRFKSVALVGARGRVVDECSDRVEPVPDLRWIGQRRCKPLRQKPRAGRGHCSIDGGEKRATPLAAEGADQFEIATRCLIDGQRRSRRLAHRRRQRGAFTDLRPLDIRDHRRCRGQFDPGERAERGRRRDAEEQGKAAFGGGAVENVARQRCHRRQRAQIRREFVVGIKPIRDDDFAWLDPGDFGGQRCAAAFADVELAGRDIDPGQCETVLVGRRPGARQRETFSCTG